MCDTNAEVLNELNLFVYVHLKLNFVGLQIEKVLIKSPYGFKDSCLNVD